MKTVVQGWIKSYHSERTIYERDETKHVVEFAWHGGGTTLRLTTAQWAAIDPHCSHCGHFDMDARVSITIEKVAK